MRHSREAAAACMRSRRVVVVVAVLAVLVSVVPGAVTAISARGAASRCTIRGTNHADRLVGTARADVICGLGGRDVIFAGGGADAVYGGAGNDTIFAEAGNDLVYGGPGDDTIYGGSGNDRLVGGTGNDFADEGGGRDRILLGGGDDVAVALAARASLVSGGPGWDRARLRSNDRRVGIEQLLTASPPGAVSVLAAGDIATCNSFGDEKTALLLDVFRDDQVLALGDEAYPSGTERDFANCFAPTWGRAKARTHPVPGNHEYESAKAAPYFAYFGQAAAPPSGYYSFDLGGWHIIALNSVCEQIGGCDPTSPEYKWLADDLNSHPSRCTLAYWHHPVFSSVRVQRERLLPIWNLLASSGADLVLNGHAHIYERFAPLSPSGLPDAAHGMREIIVGTGGGAHEHFNGTAAAGSESRNDSSFGVLRLTLRPDSYSWQFIPAIGSTFTDSGSQSCH